MSQPREPYRVPTPPPPDPPGPAPMNVYPTLLWGLGTIALGPLGVVGAWLVSYRVAGASSSSGTYAAMILGPALAVGAFVPVVISSRRIRAATVEPRWSMTVGLVVGGIVSLVVALLAFVTPFLAGLGSPGRPYRVLGRAVRGSARASDEWRDGAGPDASALEGAERAARAQRWEHAGADEHASIAAFAQLSLDLLALGAPADLVARCHHAALDEIAHAQGCFAIASAYGGAPRGPGPLAPVVLAARPSYASLAAESVVDGCLNEGLAALQAREQLERSTDPVERSFLAKVAVDEDRHAALAEDIVRFCVARGGARARDAAQRMFDESASRSSKLPASIRARTQAALDGRAA